MKTNRSRQPEWAHQFLPTVHVRVRGPQSSAVVAPTEMAGDPVAAPTGPEGSRKNLSAAGAAVGAGRWESKLWDTSGVYRKLFNNEPLDVASATWLLTALRNRNRDNDTHPISIPMNEITDAVSANRPLSETLRNEILLALPELSAAVVSAIELQPASIPENVGGISTSHLQRLAHLAEETGLSIAIARSNPAALRWHIPRVTTKPRSLKPKSQKFGEFAGLVTNPRHPNIRGQWQRARRAASRRGDAEQVRAIRQALCVALETWDENVEHLFRAGYHVDDHGRLYRMRQEQDGVVRPTFLHADYDLVGIWQDIGDATHLVDMSSTPGPGEAILQQLNKATGKRAYFRHGAVFDPSYAKREMRGDTVLVDSNGINEIISDEAMRTAARQRSLDLPAT